jgi:hypothetical protein
LEAFDHRCVVILDIIASLTKSRVPLPPCAFPPYWNRLDHTAVGKGKRKRSEL